MARNGRNGDNGAGGGRDRFNERGNLKRRGGSKVSLTAKEPGAKRIFAGETGAKKAKRIFAGETEAQALAREAQGITGRGQVAAATGGLKAKASVGGLQAAGVSGRGTRSGLAINR